MNNEIENLKNQNEQLKLQIQQLKKEEKIKDDMVLKQARFAVMGEMIGNIAHQWRQPLMELSSLMMKEEAKIKLLQQTNPSELLEMFEKSNNILDFMSTTIDDFKNFFATQKQKEEFFVAKQISQALSMMKNSFKQHNIKIEVYMKNNIKILGIKNEFTQVILNILSNAKEVLLSSDIKDKKIILKIYKKDDKNIIEIEDNGGGIKVVPIEKIFEPYYTSGKKNGTGIGLFMSRLIIHNNFHGKLEASNHMGKASFKIVLP